MTKESDKVNRGQLQALYNESAQSKVILDYFASFERDRSITKVDRILSQLRQNGNQLSRGEVIRVFQRLAELDCGTFVPGRHKHPSRFEWKVSLMDVGQAAAGEAVKIEPAPASGSDEPGDDDSLLEHHFRLRKDLDVPLRLPADLTAAEASRLAAFIQTLPFAVNQAATSQGAS
jgi:hypothetical protein